MSSTEAVIASVSASGSMAQKMVSRMIIGGRGRVGAETSPPRAAPPRDSPPGPEAELGGPLEARAGGVDPGHPLWPEHRRTEQLEHQVGPDVARADDRRRRLRHDDHSPSGPSWTVNDTVPSPAKSARNSSPGR